MCTVAAAPRWACALGGITSPARERLWDAARGRGGELGCEPARSKSGVDPTLFNPASGKPRTTQCYAAAEERAPPIVYAAHSSSTRAFFVAWGLQIWRASPSPRPLRQQRRKKRPRSKSCAMSDGPVTTRRVDLAKVAAHVKDILVREPPCPPGHEPNSCLGSLRRSCGRSSPSSSSLGPRR